MNVVIVVDILAIGVGVVISSFAITAMHNRKIPIPLAMGIRDKRDQAHVMNQIKIINKSKIFFFFIFKIRKDALRF